MNTVLSLISTRGAAAPAASRSWRSASRGEEITSEALSYGLDDLSGTLTEERIAHATTVQTPLGLSQERMEGLIRAGGKVPAERNTLYGGVSRDGLATSA